METKVDNVRGTAQREERVTDDGHDAREGVSGEDKCRRDPVLAQEECQGGRVACTMCIHSDLACRRAYNLAWLSPIPYGAMQDRTLIWPS
jgi:hypothetical protein